MGWAVLLPRFACNALPAGLPPPPPTACIPTYRWYLPAHSSAATWTCPVGLPHSWCLSLDLGSPIPLFRVYRYIPPRADPRTTPCLAVPHRLHYPHTHHHLRPPPTYHGRWTFPRPAVCRARAGFSWILPCSFLHCRVAGPTHCCAQMNMVCVPADIPTYLPHHYSIFWVPFYIPMDICVQPPNLHWPVVLGSAHPSRCHV